MAEGWGAMTGAGTQALLRGVRVIDAVMVRVVRPGTNRRPRARVVLYAHRHPFRAGTAIGTGLTALFLVCAVAAGVPLKPTDAPLLTAIWAGSTLIFALLTRWEGIAHAEHQEQHRPRPRPVSGRRIAAGLAGWWAAVTVLLWSEDKAKHRPADFVVTATVTATLTLALVVTVLGVGSVGERRRRKR
ncbi:hypothetical protein ACN2WE_32225 [Streptomyces sp. cg28]|uniref:hypothetical protein n=1 Tax=Streptomyces sp. cg28 TaxID=3403457 RepID=UPI003B210B4B